MIGFTLVGLLALGEPAAVESLEPPAPHVPEDGSVSRRVHLQLDGDPILPTSVSLSANAPQSELCIQVSRRRHFRSSATAVLAVTP